MGEKDTRGFPGLLCRGRGSTKEGLRRPPRPSLSSASPCAARCDPLLTRTPSWWGLQLRGPGEVARAREVGSLLPGFWRLPACSGSSLGQGQRLAAGAIFFPRRSLCVLPGASSAGRCLRALSNSKGGARVCLHPGRAALGRRKGPCPPSVWDSGIPDSVECRRRKG